MGTLKDNYILMGDMANDWYEQNKSHFWTGVSMLGTIATAFASSNDTARVFRKCQKKYACDPSELPVKVRLQEYWQDFAPTAACVGISLFGAGKSDHESTKLIAERTGAYLVTKKAYDTLKSSMKEVVGEKKAQQVEQKVAERNAQEIIRANPIYDRNSLPVVGRPEQEFIDKFSGWRFMSNIDYLRLGEMKLQSMMREISPRNTVLYHTNAVRGVAYREWLCYIGMPQELWNTPERDREGWNKGCDPDGFDDDVIQFTTNPIEVEEGRSALEIEWETEPTDMRLGTYLKLNGV